MNKFGVLMRLNIRNRLAALRGGGLRGESGKGKAGKIATGFFVGLAYLMILAMVIFFEFAVFESLKAIGCPELLLSMALTVVMAGMVLMSFFYVLTSLYYGRDITFLASLPATSRTIFGAKLSEVLLGETGIAAVALLPAMVLYGVNVPVDVFYWVRMVLVVLTSAMMPVSLTALLATVVVRLTGGSKHKDAVTILYSILIMVLVLWIEFSFMGSTNDDGDHECDDSDAGESTGAHAPTGAGVSAVLVGDAGLAGRLAAFAGLCGLLGGLLRAVLGAAGAAVSAALLVPDGERYFASAEQGEGEGCASAQSADGAVSAGVQGGTAHADLCLQQPCGNYYDACHADRGAVQCAERG